MSTLDLVQCYFYRYLILALFIIIFRAHLSFRFQSWSSTAAARAFSSYSLLLLIDEFSSVWDHKHVAVDFLHIVLFCWIWNNPIQLNFVHFCCCWIQFSSVKFTMLCIVLSACHFIRKETNSSRTELIKVLKSRREHSAHKTIESPEKFNYIEKLSVKYQMVAVLLFAHLRNNGIKINTLLLPSTYMNEIRVHHWVNVLGFNAVWMMSSTILV